MKIFKQLIIIIGFYFGGEILSHYLHLPTPGSITGMLLFLIFLLTGIIKEKDIAETADFFLDNLGFFFIPAGVSVMISYKTLEGNYLSTLFIIIASTVLVIIASSLITQVLIKLKEKKNGKTD